MALIRLVAWLLLPASHSKEINLVCGYCLSCDDFNPCEKVV